MPVILRLLFVMAAVAVATVTARGQLLNRYPGKYKPSYNWQPQPKAILSLEVPPLLNADFRLGLHFMLWRGVGVRLSAGYGFRNFSQIYNIDRLTGGSFEGQLRLYLYEPDPVGWYVAPFYTARYASFTLPTPVPDPNGGPLRTGGTVFVNGIGLLGGYQWFFGDYFVLDGWLGMGGQWGSGDHGALRQTVVETYREGFVLRIGGSFGIYFF